MNARIEAIAVRVAYNPELHRSELRERVKTKPKHVYRGLAIKPSSSDWESIKRWSRPPMEESEIGQHFNLGPLVLDFLEKRHGGLGVHWSVRESMAKTAAYVRGREQNSLPVVLTVEFDEGTVDWDADDTSGFTTEGEIPLKPGARVKVTDVYLPDLPLSERVKHILRSPKVARV